MCSSSSLSVIFSTCPQINNHLFAKALKWAEQNPDHEILWIRRNPLDTIPKLSLDWSSHINSLKRLKFRYNSKNLPAACMNNALMDETSKNVAAIFVSLEDDVSGADFGAVLASMAHFCEQNEGRAVVCVEKKSENPPSVDDESNDFWEKGPTAPKKDTKPKNEAKNDNNNIEKLKLVSTIYTEQIYTYESENTGLKMLNSEK